MSDPKYHTALFFLAIAQLSTFVLVIVLLARVPPYEHTKEQHERLKTEIVERLINDPKFQNNLELTNRNARQLDNIQAIIQDAVRVEISKAHNRPSSILEQKMKPENTRLTAKK